MNPSCIRAGMAPLPIQTFLIITLMFGMKGMVRFSDDLKPDP